jgi:hypothetical protein
MRTSAIDEGRHATGTTFAPFCYNARSLHYYLSLSGLVITAFLPLIDTNAGHITDYP